MTNEELACVYHTTKDAELKLKIRNKLIEMNYNFIRLCCFTYFKGSYGAPKAMELQGEFIGTATIGFIKGLDKFTPNKGVKLISYCVWWIRHMLGSQSREDLTGLVLPPCNYLDLMKKGKYTHASYTSDTISNEEGETSILDLVDQGILSMSPMYESKSIPYFEVDTEKLREYAIKFVKENVRNTKTKVLSMERMAIDSVLDRFDLTLQETANKHNVSKERVRQVRKNFDIWIQKKGVKPDDFILRSAVDS